MLTTRWNRISLLYYVVIYLSLRFCIKFVESCLIVFYLFCMTTVYNSTGSSGSWQCIKSISNKHHLVLLWLFMILELLTDVQICSFNYLLINLLMSRYVEYPLCWFVGDAVDIVTSDMQSEVYPTDALLGACICFNSMKLTWWCSVSCFDVLSHGY